MCRIDDCDERWEWWDTSFRKARKPYKCEECHGPIVVGETYEYTVAKYDGHLDVYRTCAHCQVAKAWLYANCGGALVSEVIEEIKEHAEEYPRLALPLLRIVAGARRKWRAFNADSL